MSQTTHFSCENNPVDELLEMKLNEFPPPPDIRQGSITRLATGAGRVPIEAV